MKRFHLIKEFVKYYKPHMKLFILDMACAFLISGIDLIFPSFTKLALDDYIPNSKMKNLLITTIILIVLFSFRAIFNYIVNYWGHVVGVRMEYDMRKKIFSHLQTLSFSYFDKVRTGKIMSRIINDLREIAELAHHGPEDLFISAVIFLGSFIILIQTNVLLTIMVFAYVPIMLWYGIWARKNMSKAFKKVRKKIANVNAQLENSISGIRVSQSFTNEDFESQKFDYGNIEFKEAREYAYKAMSQMMTGINFLSNLLKVTVLGLGGYFTFKGYISLGTFVAFFLYIELFLQPVRRMMQFSQQFEAGMAGFERYVEIMNIKPEIVDEPGAIKLNKIKGNIIFDNVSFSYEKGKPVVSNIDFNIESGKTIALVGPSGGGKTTICHLIPRFYDVDSGSILIDDMDIRKIKLESLRGAIGFVQQDVFLFAGTIKDNISYGKGNATDDEVIEAAKKAEIHDFIMTLDNGYDTYIGERGVLLSGGQKQRISIARVFLKNPPILILDEATSALDNETELKIQKSFEELSKGRTTLVIAHRLSTIKNADEILVITEKGIIERGSHEQLMYNHGHYEMLYKSQFKGYIPDL